jgi:hypothetical protein
MKNLIFLFCFGLMLSLTFNCQAQTTKAIKDTTVIQASSGEIPNPTPIIVTTPPTPNKGFFTKILDGIKGDGWKVAVGLLFGLFVPKVWTLLIKKITGKGAVILNNVGEFFVADGSLLSAINGAIKDDGTLKENSIADVMSAGKEVIAKAGDVIISIKPNPTSAPA